MEPIKLYQRMKKKNSDKNFNEFFNFIESLADNEMVKQLLKQVVSGDEESIEALRMALLASDIKTIVNDVNNNRKRHYDSEMPYFDIFGSTKDDEMDDDSEMPHFDMFGGTDDDDDAMDKYLDLAPYEMPDSDATLPRATVRELHLRIAIKNSPIEVWREVKMPSNMTVYHAARALLEITGWAMESYFDVEKGGNVYDLAGMSMLEDIDDAIDSTTITIGELLKDRRSRIMVKYNFVCKWLHTVSLIASRPYEAADKRVVTLIAGSGACPPEGCFPDDYKEVISILKKEKWYKKDREMMEKYDISRPYDPTMMDTNLTDKALQRINEWLTDKE